MSVPADLETRLLACFADVFPNVPRDQLPRLSVTSSPEWDSVATVTLVAVIEQEFRISIHIDDLPEMLSFDLAKSIVAGHLNA